VAKSYDDLKNMFDKGRYELGQALRGQSDSLYLAPEYQNQSMDEKQVSYLEQVQDGIEVPQQEPQQEQQKEVQR